MQVTKSQRVLGSDTSEGGLAAWASRLVTELSRGSLADCCSGVILYLLSGVGRMS